MSEIVKNAVGTEQVTKTTIILLPGLNGTDGLFKPLIECASNEYEVITVFYPTHTHLNYAQLRDVVLEKIKEVKTPFILVGESFSGPLSLMISQTSPAGLSGIILVATFITPPSWSLVRHLPWTLGFTLTKPLYRLREMLSVGKNRSFIKAISNELQKVEPKVLSGRIKSIFDVNVTQALAECELPLMYFRGTKDYVVPKRNLELIINIKPDIKVVEFNTQHFLLQSQPDQAWREIASFADSLR